jgi:hypothetical protein
MHQELLTKQTRIIHKINTLFREHAISAEHCIKVTPHPADIAYNK